MAKTRGDKVDAKLVSEYLDARYFWLDPWNSIQEDRIQEAAKKLDIPAEDVRRRYEALADAWGLRLAWRPTPAVEPSTS